MADSDHTDRELIDALKVRGYLVPKKAHVKTLNVLSVYPTAHISEMASAPEWYEHVKRTLAARVGAYLLRSNSLEFMEQASTIEPGLSEIVATVTVIIPDPETFRDA